MTSGNRAGTTTFPSPDASRLSQPDAPGPMPRREELAFVVFSTWMILGLFLDGWAHNTDKPETFFTPWHGLLYSGFGAALAWGALEGLRTRGQPKVPVAGQRITVLGAVIFGIGGGTDFAWHELFGLEEGIEGLLSPTHLMLMLGGLLAASSPLRAAVATRRERDAFPTLSSFIAPLVALTGCTALAGFFLQFLSAFNLNGFSFAVADTTSNDASVYQIYGIASVLITNLLLLVPTLFVARRWRTPFGAFAIFYGVVALGLTGLESFERVILVVPAVVAGLAADVLVRRSASILVLATVVPAVLWSGYFALTVTLWEFAWPVELPTGTVVFAVLCGLAVALSGGAVTDASSTVLGRSGGPGLDLGEGLGRVGADR